MLLIGTWLPEASEEEAGRRGAALDPVRHFSKALGNTGSPHPRGSSLQNGPSLRGGALVDRQGRGSGAVGWQARWRPMREAGVG